MQIAKELQVSLKKSLTSKYLTSKKPVTNIDIFHKKKLSRVLSVDSSFIL